MKLWRNWMGAALLAALVLSLAGCGSSGGAGASPGPESSNQAGGSVTANEDYFIWQGKTITGLSDRGLQQEELVVPARCEEIGDYAFTRSQSLRRVSFESDQDIQLGSAFQGVSTVESITLPAQLTSLADCTFSLCSALKSIDIPAGVTEIQEDGFEFCEALEEVNFLGDHITAIPEGAFNGCTSLTSINLPDSITFIGPQAFQNCESLTSITLPEGLKTLGSIAFTGCNLTQMVIPAGMELEVYDPETLPFYNCTHDDGMTVYVTEGSWADEHFNELWGFTSMTKAYSAD